jgi:hypothetical protein
MTLDDMEGRLKADLRYAGKDRLTITRTADLRALLLDYQKRGRALEELLASTVGPEVGASDGGTFVIQPPSPDALRRARATLKGKIHD